LFFLSSAKVVEVLSSGAGLEWEKEYIARDGLPVRGSPGHRERSSVADGGGGDPLPFPPAVFGRFDGSGSIP
jgi:hypothetical protein